MMSLDKAATALFAARRRLDEIAFDAIRPTVLAFNHRDPMTWQLSDVGCDTQQIVNDVLAAFAREGYELRNRRDA
jgi:hypothetical protein